MEIFKEWAAIDSSDSGQAALSEDMDMKSPLFSQWPQWNRGDEEAFKVRDEQSVTFDKWASGMGTRVDSSVEESTKDETANENQTKEADIISQVNVEKGLCIQKQEAEKGGCEGKKVGIREICEAAAEYLQLIRVDGKLYYRTGTYFPKLDSDTLGKLLFKHLPEEFVGALYNASIEKVFKKLEATNLVEGWSMEEIRTEFSDYVALENGYYNVSTGDFYSYFGADFAKDLSVDDSLKGPIIGADRRIICLTGICASYQERPEATPTFDAFIDQMSDGDERRRERFLDFLAVILMTGKKAKKFYVLGVAPDSGKSTIANLLEAFFPLGSISRMDIHDLGRNFALAAVAESPINISMDLTAEPLKARAVSNIKLLTGERRIQVEEKFKQPRVTNCCGKLVFGTNHPLVLLSPDPALFNRLEVIPVTRQIPVEEQNPNLQAQLLAEIDGIVSKLLQRTMRLCERNLELTPCPLATQMKREWMESREDLATAFVKEFCIITNDPEDYLESAELHELYVEYCIENGTNPEATNAFTRRIRKLISPECGRFSREKRPEGGGPPVRIVRGLTWRIDNEYEGKE